MRDWRRGEEYDFTETLNGGQWAWEFLRRNPDYKREWAAFRETWQVLESEYGRAPNRDFCQWRLDPRAWVPAVDCPEGDCRIDSDKVLIECALGARWGFYKFPPDPADDDPVGHNRLAWRPVKREVALLDGEAGCRSGDHLGVCFDLTLPLREQVEQAKRLLQMEQRRRIRDGKVRLRTVRSMAPIWRSHIRLLDALVAGAGEDEIAEALFHGDVRMFSTERREAERLLAGGYRELPLLPEG